VRMARYFLILGLPVLVSVGELAIPELIRARKAGNETSSFGGLRTYRSPRFPGCENDPELVAELQRRAIKEFPEGAPVPLARAQRTDFLWFWPSVPPVYIGRTGDRFPVVHTPHAARGGPLAATGGGAPGHSVEIACTRK
jgi:hypothetical protein